jgi:hypothetical protein
MQALKGEDPEMETCKQPLEVLGGVQVTNKKGGMVDADLRVMADGRTVICVEECPIAGIFGRKSLVREVSQQARGATATKAKLPTT